MAPRFSLPSASVGVNRFHCWPVDTTDSYNAAELTANFDLVDSIVGVPSGGTAWPTVLGIDGGIYREIQLLKAGAYRLPIGSVFSWFRVNNTISLPPGTVVCDGSTFTAGNHDFPVIGSVTIPDLRNRFILGADPTKPDGTAAATVGSTNIDSSVGAPGANATGGSNQHILSVAELAVHKHGFTDDNGQPTRIPTINQIDIGDTNLGPAPGVHAATSTANAGSGSAHENRPFWTGLIYLCQIKNVTSF